MDTYISKQGLKSHLIHN